MTGASAGSQATQLDGFQWLPALTSRQQRSFSIASDGTLSAPTTGGGSLEFLCSPDLGNEEYSTYDWQGALGRIYYGYEGDPFSSYTLQFTGSVGSLSQKGNRATVELLGQESLLAGNLLTTTYAGTGGIEGGPDLLGNLKPRAYGPCLAVTPIAIDTVFLVYQVHGYGPVDAITNVYEFAEALAPVKTDVASYSDLIALTLAPGEWASCLASGLFRLGAQPKNKLVADIQVDRGNIADITRAMLNQSGILDTEIGTLLFQDKPYNLFVSDQTSILDASRSAYQQGGGYLFCDASGYWQTGDFYATKPPIVIADDGTTLPQLKSINLLATAPPVYKVSVGYDRCYSVHSESDVSPALSQLADAQIAQQAAVEAASEAAAQAQADVGVQGQRIFAQDSDAIVSRGEKADRLLQLSIITTEYAGLSTQGSQFNVVTQQANYVTAYANLTNYIAGLVPPLTDAAHDTPIDPLLDQLKYNQFYQARADLEIANTGKAAQTGDYTLIRDDGGTKPQDNATKGAPAGTLVAGVDAAVVVNNGQTALITSNQNSASITELTNVTLPAIRDTQSADRAALSSATTTAQTQADAARRDIASEIANRATSENNITTSITNLTTTVGQNTSAITSEATQRTTADGALGIRIDTVTTGYQAADAMVSASVTSEAATRSNADGALGTRIDNVTSGYIAANSATQANVTAEALTRANADSALSSRTSSIESTYNTVSAGLVSNDHFANWPDGQSIPTGWPVWGAAANFTTSRVTGFGGSPYAVYTTCDANGENGFYYPGVTFGAGKIIVECTYQNVSGGLSGAGVTLSGVYNIDFMSDPDTNGQIGDIGTPIRTFSKTFDIAAGAYNVHAMSGWGGFGRTRSSHYIKWFSLSVRPASVAEALSYANTARIATEESTRASADSSLATQISTVVTNYQAGDAANATNITNGTNSLSNATLAVANRTSTLEATSQTNGALNNDVTFQVWPATQVNGQVNQNPPSNWNNYDAGPSGVTHLSRVPGKYGQGYAMRVAVPNNVNDYIAQALTPNIPANTWVVLDIEFTLNSGDLRCSGTYYPGAFAINFSTERNAAGNVIGAGTPGFTYQVKKLIQCPGQAQGVYCMTRWGGIGDVSQGSADITWYRNSIRAATTIEIDSQQVVSTTLPTLTARVATEESARAAGDSAIATRTTTLEAGVQNAISRNGDFSINADWSTVPTNWNVWSQDANTTQRMDTSRPGSNGQRSQYMYRSGGGGNQNVGMYQNLSNVAQGWYVITADVEQTSGVWQGAGVHMNLSGNPIIIVNFGSDADNSGLVFGGNYGTRRRWSRLVFNPLNANSGPIYAMGGWNGFGDSTQEVELFWHECSIRAASSAEIYAQKASDANLIARVTTNEGAVSNLNGKTTAYWQTTAVAGNNRAQLTIHADANGGAGVDIVGDVAISGSVKIGSAGSTADVLAATALASAPVTFYTPIDNTTNDNQFAIRGLQVTKIQPNRWYSNVYSREGYTNGAVIQGLFSPGQGEKFFGLSDNRGYNNSNDYGLINYAWYTTGGNQWNIFELGSAPYSSQSFGPNTVFKIVYDGVRVTYYADATPVRVVPTNSGRTFYAAITTSDIGSVQRISSFGPYTDNSLTNADPAGRINQGGTTVNGGMITANSVTANQLQIGSAGGARTQIIPNQILVYDSNNTLRVRMGVW